MDKRIRPRRYLLQSGFHDQRAHVPRREKMGIFESFRTPAAASPLEMGERLDAGKARQRNDPEVDAAT